MLSRDALPTGLCSRIHLGKEMCVHTREDPEISQIWAVNQANQNDWPRETRKKCPIKVIQTATGCPSVTLSQPGHVSVHTYSTLFPLSTLLASLFLFFVGILFCKAEKPGPLSPTTGLVGRIWRSHRWDPASISSWEPKPHFKLLQAEATRVQAGVRKSTRICTARICTLGLVGGSSLDLKGQGSGSTATQKGPPNRSCDLSVNEGSQPIMILK